jgi:hypothetical protein
MNLLLKRLPADLLPASPRDQLDSLKNFRLKADSPDPGKVAAFWADALGYRRTFDEPDQVCLEPPAGSAADGVARPPLPARRQR